MSAKKDLDYIVKVEKAISKKYGEEAIQNPKSGWSPDKEEDYVEQSKKLQKKINKGNQERELVEVNGYLMPSKLINVSKTRTCTICSVYSFDSKDGFYMNRYECCFQCYIQWVEGREERWLQGWRPDKENK